MTGEQVAGAVVLASLGTALLTVGVLGWRGRIDFALGGWSRDQASPESWRAAHLAIGRSLCVAGAIALVGVVAVVMTRSAWAGPLVVGFSVALLVPVVIGAAYGASRVEARRGDL